MGKPKGQKVGFGQLSFVLSAREEESKGVGLPAESLHLLVSDSLPGFRPSQWIDPL